MKKYSILILWLVCAFQTYAGNAPTPKKVYSIVRELHDVAWYKEQATLWKTYLDENPKDQDAWLYFYRAVRNIKLLDEDPTPYSKEMILEGVQKNIPNSYIKHLLTYLESPKHFVDNSELQKAFETAPDRWETYPEMMTYFSVNYNEAEVEKFAKKWLESSEVSSEILAWNYNALIGLPKNAILITFGDNDTLPMWVLQYARGVRQDVTIINYFLSSFGRYRIAHLSKMGLDDPGNAQDLNDPQEVVKTLIKSSSNPVYLMASAGTDLVKDLEKDLYLTGLTYRYSTRKYDNIAELKDNFESFWLKDNLKSDISADISVSVMKNLNANYLPALICLYRDYTAIGEQIKAEEVKEITLNIANSKGETDEILPYFTEENKWKSNPMVTINTKSLEKQMKKVQNGLFAGETELTNDDYNLFLEDLLKRKEFGKLDIAKPKNIDWNAYLTDEQKKLSNVQLWEHGYYDKGNFPVVNISYEAAVLYCEWLTDIYNNSASKKKSFTKVKFRLPNAAEWEAAAKANEGLYFPWKGDKAQNLKGCYLGNFQVSQEKPCENCSNKSLSNDGGFFLVATGTYFPNAFGLYNTVGNVAEMVAEKGTAKGGSWYHSIEKSKISEQQSYEKSEPYIGVRVFMEVLKSE